MPPELRKAIKEGVLTEDQIRELIEHETGLSFDEAERLIDAGEAPDTVEWVDARLLLELLRLPAA